MTAGTLDMHTPEGLQALIPLRVIEVCFKSAAGGAQLALRLAEKLPAGVHRVMSESDLIHGTSVVHIHVEDDKAHTLFKVSLIGNDGVVLATDTPSNAAG